MRKIVAAKPLANCRVWIKFNDGAEGTVDWSDLAGKGVFEKFNEPPFFNLVFVDRESHTVAWPGGIDLCPDSLYAEITGQDLDSILKSDSAASR